MSKWQENIWIASGKMMREISVEKQQQQQQQRLQLVWEVEGKTTKWQENYK